jgi:hypothetical protein
MFTPSQTHRVEKCPVSETLPHIQRETEYSAAGTTAHWFYQQIRDLRAQGHALPAARELALRQVEDPEQLAVLEALPLEDPRMPSLDPAAYTAELALALNLTTGAARVLGKGLTREQAHALAEPEEMVGIADLAAQAGTKGVVLDLKFGHGRVPRAAVNLQTDTYLLMLTRALGLEEGLQGIVRVFGEDDVWTDVVERDSLELDDHLQRLRALARTVEELRARPPTERPQPVEGRHCDYCPAFLSCPAKMRLLREVLADPDTALPAPPPDADVAADLVAVGQGWLRLRRAQQVMERVEKLYKVLARVQPIPLKDGEVLGERVSESEALVGWRAAQLLEQRLGALGKAVVDEARSEMTGASLERALKKHLMPTLPRTPKGKPQPYAPVERDLWELFRESGATKPTVIRRIVEHVPKAPLPALPAGEREVRRAEVDADVAALVREG